MSFFQAVISAGTRYVPITAQDLKLFYDPNNSLSYPGSGTTLYDLSGNGRHATIYGGATWTNYGGVNVFYFDGINDYIETNSNTTEVSFSLSMYVRHDNNATGTTQRVVASKWYTSQLSWITDCFTSLERFITRTGGSTFSMSTSQTSAAWQYLVITYASGTGQSKIYRNGSLLQTNTLSTSLQFATNPIQFARKGDATTGFFLGHIGQIAVHDKVLSATDITDNFNATKSSYGL
jgi:hypothetical protein